MSARASGAVLLAEGDAKGALAALRRSWEIWSELDAPYEAARTRVLIGCACKASSDCDAALLELAEEKAVASALAEVERSVKPALEKEDFAQAMQAFAGLRAPIDAFFDKVTVNVTDRPDLRLNRLKLLNQIRATMDAVADFSKIEG